MALSPDAFSDFLTDLSRSGYVIDPGQLAAVHHLVLLSGSGAWPGGDDRLGNLIAPVLARTPIQQADILYRFETWRPILFADGRENTAPQPARRFGVRSPRLESIPDKGTDAVANVTRVRQRSVITTLVIFLSLAFAVGSIATFWQLYPASVPTTKAVQGEGTVAPPSDASPTPGIRHLEGPVFAARPLSSTLISGTPEFSAWSTMLPIILGAAPLVLAVAILFARRRSDQRLRRLASSSPRDLAEMSILVPDTPLFEGALSELAANDLGRPRRLLGETLDIERSLEATARAAGAPQFVFAMRSLTPFYAVFIEEASRHDHLARLADILIDRLSEAGVLTDRYYLLTSGLVRTREDRHFSLKEVADLHGDDRILLLGPAESVLDDQRGTLVESLCRDAGWADRAYLVLGRIDALTARLLTNEGFALAPATPTGMRALGRYIASAPREIGEVLVPVPGLQREPVLRPLASISPAELKLFEVRLQLINTLRAPSQQLMYQIGQRFNDIEEDEGAYAAGENASRAGQDHLPAGLVLNRAILQDFLNDVGLRDKVLIVNGPPGSGKSFTTTIARRLLGDGARIIVVNLQSGATLESVVRDIHRLLGAGASTETQSDSRAARRHATEIRRLISATSKIGTLMIFDNEDAELQPSIIDLIVDLTQKPENAQYIVLGISVSQFASNVAVENLREFTEWEISEGIERVVRHMRLPLEAVDDILREVAKIDRGDRYNARIGSALQTMLKTRLRETGRGSSQ